MCIGDWHCVFISGTEKNLVTKFDMWIKSIISIVLIMTISTTSHCLHPCSKVIRIFFAMSNDGIYFQCVDLNFFCVASWGLLHLLWKIWCVYVIASRLCEHSKLARFEKRAAKTPQCGLRCGKILMLYDIINTYEWFFCYNWHELCSSNKLLDFSIIYCFKYAF